MVIQKLANIVFKRVGVLSPTLESSGRGSRSERLLQIRGELWENISPVGFQQLVKFQFIPK